jgi:hypothetical protein
MFPAPSVAIQLQADRQIRLEEARALVTLLVIVWETADDWDGKKVARPTRSRQEEPQAERMTIADAGKVFLSHREGAKIAAATLRKSHVSLSKRRTFADTHG